jgi:hypothetical protein
MIATLLGWIAASERTNHQEEGLVLDAKVACSHFGRSPMPSSG